MRSENRTEILLSYTEPLVLEAYLLLNFVDFCHDSANHASMVALAAPKVLASCFLNSIPCGKKKTMAVCVRNYGSFW